MASLEFAGVAELPKDKLGVIIRLVVWDINEETGVQSLRDVKEQQISLTPPTDLVRFAAFTRALVRVATRAIERPELETLMPYDFVKFDALKLAKASTEEDFVTALSVKSRLGKYFQPQPTGMHEAPL